MEKHNSENEKQDIQGYTRGNQNKCKGHREVPGIQTCIRL